MKIQIGGLSEGTHEYGFHPKAEEIGLPEDFSGEVDIAVTLDKTPTQMLLRGEVRAEGRFICDRCLTEFALPVKARYRMCYVMDGGQFEGVDPAELQVISPASGFIDITDDVRQTVLLAVPLKLLCSDSCTGLCPHCGKNRNRGSCSCTAEISDTRWEPLRSLRGKEQEGMKG